MWHHDYLFWCGDFNYRIDLTKDEVIDLIQTENFAGLQAYDQLNAQRQSGAVTLLMTCLPPYEFLAGKNYASWLKPCVAMEITGISQTWRDCVKEGTKCFGLPRQGAQVREQWRTRKF